MKFQIDFNKGQGSHAFKYFRAEDGKEFREKANDIITEFFNQPVYFPCTNDCRNIKIREYDMEKHAVIKKGFDYIVTKVKQQIITYEVLTEPNIN